MKKAVKRTTNATLEQVMKQNQKLVNSISKLQTASRCFHCGKLKPKNQFYVSTDPQNKAGVTAWCKECCSDVAMRKDQYGQYHASTIDSVKTVLQHIDKPFIMSVWQASVDEIHNEGSAGKIRKDPWLAMIKNLQMPQYTGLRWKDSDMFKASDIEKKEEKKEQPQPARQKSIAENYADYIKNKQDINRLLGYDPFEKQAEQDQPFLYAQLIGMLDSSQDANEDMVRISSAISIVRGFLQESKIDDTITKLMGNTKEVANNSATIKSLQDSKAKLTSMITSLAKESCLSLNNSKTVTKGTNTWTGKIQKIKELNLRDGEVNGFDINTCRGFQQVQEISDASIMKQLRLDDSDWSDMVADMREANQKLRKEKNSYQEINRILLRENMDLKDELSEKGYNVKAHTANLKDLYSVFRDNQKGVEFQPEEGESDGPDNSSV